MLTITLKQLASIIKSLTGVSPSNSIIECTSVITDSRQITPGCCFFAIEGKNFDGHNYVNDAFDQGAVCAVVSKKIIDPAKSTFIVEDTIEALGRLARWYRNTLAGKVIAITGSAGKTTTRQMTHHVLSDHYKCHQSPRSFNNNIGLPLTLLSADSDTQFIIAELGTNAPGEIEYLTDIAQPDISVVLNALAVHLEGLGSVENIIAEKSSIARSLKPDGSFLINSDRAIIDYCTKQQYLFTTFGTEPDSDISVSDISLEVDSSSMMIDGVSIKVPIPSAAAVQNAIAAWAICKTVGLNAEQFAQSIQTFKSPSMRMQVQRLSSASGAITIIDDCYNANPSSMANAIEYLSALKADTKNSRSVLICGTMGELGSESQMHHKQIGKLASDLNIDLILAAGPFTDVLTEAAADNNPATETYIYQTTEQLCNKLHDFIKPDDIILIKGSRSAVLEQAVSVLKTLFC